MFSVFARPFFGNIIELGLEVVDIVTPFNEFEGGGTIFKINQLKPN